MGSWWQWCRYVRSELRCVERCACLCWCFLSPVPSCKHSVGNLVWFAPSECSGVFVCLLWFGVVFITSLWLYPLSRSVQRGHWRVPESSAPTHEPSGHPSCLHYGSTTHRPAAAFAWDVRPRELHLSSALALCWMVQDEQWLQGHKPVDLLALLGAAWPWSRNASCAPRALGLPEAVSFGTTHISNVYMDLCKKKDKRTWLKKKKSSVFLLLLLHSFLRVLPSWNSLVSLLCCIAASHAKEKWTEVNDRRSPIFCVHKWLGSACCHCLPPIVMSGKVMRSVTCCFGAKGMQQHKEAGVVSKASLYHPENKMA